MQVTLVKISQAGNNVLADLKFDGSLVHAGHLMMNPVEFENFATMLEGGAGLAYQGRDGQTRTVEFVRSEA